VSRYDYIRIDTIHFKGLTEKELSEIDGLEFQTKDLEREFLEYHVGKDGKLTYMDYHYELVDNDGFFKKILSRVDDGQVSSSHTGVVMFYGKPYESLYTFQAKFTKGEIKYIRLLSIV
jgi:hypothetical protein